MAICLSNEIIKKAHLLFVVVSWWYVIVFCFVKIRVTGTAVSGGLSFNCSKEYFAGVVWMDS